MFISIITVNLNNRLGLEKTMHSVINQTSADYEWIVIDGGSTDGSKELLEKNNENISYWVSEPDNGIYNAMNKGIERSSGEYLLFLNSGDSLHSDNVISEFADSNPTCEIVCCRELINNGITPVVPPEDINYQWFLIKANSLPHQATFVKRAAFMRYGEYDDKYEIVADFKWFSNALIRFDATYEIRDIVVSDFEGGGD